MLVTLVPSNAKARQELKVQEVASARKFLRTGVAAAASWAQRLDSAQCECEPQIRKFFCIAVGKNESWNEADERLIFSRCFLGNSEQRCVNSDARFYSVSLRR